MLLRLAAHVVFRRGREAEEGVIVDRVGRVVPLLVDVAKVAKVGCEGVAVEEDGVVWVDGADGLVDAVVEGEDAGVFGVSGFVDGVVACDPFVGFEVLGETFPEPYGAVLEIFVVPDWVNLRLELSVYNAQRMNVQFAICPPWSECQSVFCPPGAVCRSKMVYMLCCAQRSITRSRCLNPDSFKTRGFISSAKENQRR